MFLTERKLHARVRDLARYRYRDGISIVKWQLSEDERGEVGSRPVSEGSGQEIHIGDRWEGRDRYAWLSARVAVPQQWSGKVVLVRLDFGRTGAGNNSGFESLLYVNGEPYQGVDSNHQEVFLPPDSPGDEVLLQLRLWSGLEGGGRPRIQEYRFVTAEICWLDADADDLYFTSVAALQTVKWLDENDADRVNLLAALNRAYHFVDWREPGSQVFYDTVASARRSMAEYLGALEKHHAVTAYCVGHTHIDVAWLWRLRHTREKVARSFSTVLRLMEQYPEYVFLQTQPQLYEYIQSDYPDIYSRLKERVIEGRWEAGGAMWLEADCNLTSGESLVRQILYGTRLFEREFGSTCTYLWLPDVFGYSWALPQILRKSGIETFMTTKISWNQYNRMPHDTFTWRGIDGSEVLAHFITTPEPGSRQGWYYTYNGQLAADTVAGAWKAYRDKEINQELLVSYGFGDGGGGVTRDMLEMRRRLDQMPGIPHVKTSRADDYFARLQKSVKGTDAYLHTWDGELYLEYHRGTYTSQAYNKRMNRKLELAYREAEWLSVWAGSKRARASREKLTQGWKIILRNQFHDIIPGSSIHEVYEDSRVEYAEASDIVSQEWWASASELCTPHSGSGVIVNSASFSRTAVLRIPDPLNTGVDWCGPDGRPFLSQEVDGEQWLLAVDVPSMGGLEVSICDPATGAVVSPFSVDKGGVETPFFSIRWNEVGQWVSLYDKRVQREVLAPGRCGNILQIFEDKPLAHDAWDIDLFYQECLREIRQLESVETVSVGPVCAVIRFSWSYGKSSLIQDLTVYAHSPRIDFATRVDWHERQQLLKVAFPVNIRATEATFDIQYGNVTRPTHWNTSWDQARFETVGHQWADLSETGYGVALANDCKYGYDIKDNVLRLSLIKSPIYPDPEADQGEHTFTYALIPHAGGWLEGDVMQQAWDLNSPLRFLAGGLRTACTSLLTLSSPSVHVDAIKWAEDADLLVVRLHEFTGGRESVTIECGLPLQRWCECNLLERPIADWQTGNPQFTIKPYEIKTILIDLKD